MAFPWVFWPGLVPLFSSARVMVREIYYAVMGDKGSQE